MIRQSLLVVLSLLAALATGIVFAALLGLGLHRHAPGWAVSLSATFLLFVPALFASSVAPKDRPFVFAAGLLAWSVGLFVLLPIYFPGERRDAIATGLAAFTFGGANDIARQMADNLPSEPLLAQPELATAEPATVSDPQPPPPPLEDNQISLAYDGETHRSVPVVFESGGKTIEVYMMLDTGATYTTLPTALMANIGLEPTKESPRIHLHTANGERDALLSLADRVWLGDLVVDNVAIAACEDCASSKTVGLLGLNVTGGYNITIDGDRREVLFTTRETHDRRLDIRPFVDLSAGFTRFP
ncbi:MAG: hypothetical protein HN348_08585, partial [Proteobacteria bacterium]|nr:hypothetical protein [Pseudomonadota bacterium]